MSILLHHTFINVFRRIYIFFMIYCYISIVIKCFPSWIILHFFYTLSTDLFNCFIFFIEYINQLFCKTLRGLENQGVLSCVQCMSIIVHFYKGYKFYQRFGDIWYFPLQVSLVIYSRAYSPKQAVVNRTK